MDTKNTLVNTHRDAERRILLGRSENMELKFIGKTEGEEERNDLVTYRKSHDSNFFSLDSVGMCVAIPLHKWDDRNILMSLAAHFANLNIIMLLHWCL